MQNDLFVGTRKGLFVLRRDATGWRVASTHFLGEPVSQLLVTPRAWFAALRLGHFGVKLKRSRDQGATWEEVGAPAFPPKPTEGPWKDDATPWSVDLIWALSDGGGARLWAGCLPAGLFRSDDEGASWQLMDDLWQQPGRKDWFGGGYDHAGIHSVLVDPRNAGHVTVAISCAGVWQSVDTGAHWQSTSTGLVAEYMPPERQHDPNVQDPHAISMCQAHPDVLWMQHHHGLYRSADAGQSWQRLPRPEPSDFGFAVVAHPSDPLRAWVVPAKADAERVPVGARMVVNETRDGGQSFVTHSQGLPEFDAYHLVYRHGLAVTDDGNTLAMGSTTGGLWTSEDGGARWQRTQVDLPPVAVLRFG